MYTEKLLLHLIKLNKHELILDKDSVVLFSICDVTELPFIEKLKQKYPNNKIVVGGHFSKIGAVAISLFADAVWIGHGFEMFEQKSFEDILAHESCYFKGKNIDVYCNYNIKWNQCPAIQTDYSRFYVFGGVGCKNKCSFCVTSWTEPWENRPGINHVQNSVKKHVGKKGSVKVISNAYDTEMSLDLVQDMLIKDFIQAKKFKKGALVRCGVEFATDETRRKNGKPVKESEIKAAFDVALANGVDLHLFMIGGIDKKYDWYKFIENIPEGDVLKPRIFLKWTNFEAQQKTPLWATCQQLNPDNYISSIDTDSFFRIGAHRNKRIRIMPVKYPAHAFWRIMMSNVKNIDEYKQVLTLKNEKDMDTVYAMFQKLKPWENDISFIKTYYDKDYKERRLQNG